MTGEAIASIQQWMSPAMPEVLRPLLDEAMQADFEWMTLFEATWRASPFVGPGEGLFIAYDEAHPVGMAAIRADPNATGPDVGRLCFVFVTAASRRRGIAEALVTTCLRHGEPFWQSITLHTDNPRAAALYRRYGFTEVSGIARATHLKSR